MRRDELNDRFDTDSGQEEHRELALQHAITPKGRWEITKTWYWLPDTNIPNQLSAKRVADIRYFTNNGAPLFWIFSVSLFLTTQGGKTTPGTTLSWAAQLKNQGGVILFQAMLRHEVKCTDVNRQHGETFTITPQQAEQAMKLYLAPNAYTQWQSCAKEDGVEQACEDKSSKLPLSKL